MKQDRHTAIRELVAGAPIGSQDELRRRLVKRGFEVTQATLSRDIHELHLYKGPNGYAAPNGLALEEDDDLPQTAELLNSLVFPEDFASRITASRLSGADPASFSRVLVVST